MTEPRKRYRPITARPGELRAAYGRAEGDGPYVCAAWQSPGPQRGDMKWLLRRLSVTPMQENGKTLIDELAERGYDITTLKFSIKHKAVTEPKELTP